MGHVSVQDADVALAAGRWAEARDGYEQELAAGGETAEAFFGLATALWWLGESRACVDRGSRAYVLLRRDGDLAGAARCAIWLAITYKANFANTAAANGWLARAERLLGPLEPGPLQGWLWVARGYRGPDLDVAEELTERAVEVARGAGDVDLELVALSQLGLIWVGKGQVAEGFALIDEAMAATLAGEGTTLETVVYACCDMLSACELASDIERAAQWCQVADDFVETYGCPFLYGECRMYYGSVLAAKGRWDEAERELCAGLRVTEGTCPGLHARGRTRLAGLRIRQGRLEEAEQLLELGEGVQAEAEEALAAAALRLARSDARAAARHVEQRLFQFDGHHLVTALDLLVDAHLATGAVAEAAAVATRLCEVASSARHQALAAGAAGRVALAEGSLDVASAHLEAALRAWSRLELPFEGARARFDLAQAVAGQQPDVAVDHARRAMATFEALVAPPEADRVAAFLRSKGIVARTGIKGVGLLTLREQEVLRLLAAGLSNPEIAQRLHVSRKTAAHHVSAILSKLQLRNRTEAAAYAMQNR